MDPGIWSRVPGEILEQILSLLPLKTFMKLRSTCKYFNSLIFSPSFISKHYSSSSSSSSSSPSSFLLLSHPQFHNHFHLYDTLVNTWHKLPLSLLSTLSCASSSCKLLSTSNGLLCFSLPSSSSFLVCNLLSRSSTIVKFPSLQFEFELLTLVSNQNGYKLFMLSSTSGSSSMGLLYDSRDNQWREFKGFNLIFGNSNHQQGVCHNSKLYFSIPKPLSIVKLDLESEKWGKMMTELPGEVTFVRLASSGSGNLFLFGGIGRNGISRSMILWELSEEGNNWIEIERVPQMMCDKFMSVCYHNYEHVYCFWHQGMICVCCYTWHEILYFKVLRKTWHWLPKCPDKWSCGFKWFSFVPQLYAYI